MNDDTRRRKPRLDVTPMSSTRELHAARMLMSAQREWLASLGIALTDSADYDDPARFYNRTGGVLLIARLDGRAIGMVGMRRLSRFPHTAELRRLFVTSSARGHGAGRILLETVLDHAFRMGYDDVVLETVPAKMVSAAKLYAALGFEEVPSMKAEPRLGGIGMRRQLRQRHPTRVRIVPRRRLVTATATSH